MPNRIIKESCRTSPTLAALSDAGERLFWRLITAADDYGRFEADAEIIKGLCLPRLKKWTAVKVEACLKEFGVIVPGEEEALVLFYRVKGRRYGQFSKWEDHQRQRDSKPKYPGPEDGTREESPNSLTAATCGDSPQPAAYPNPRDERRETRAERRLLPVLAALEAFQYEEVKEWVEKEGVDEGAARMAFIEFVDYWRSVGGKRAGGKPIKNWPATFRNRVRQLKAEGKIKLAAIVRPRPALVIAEPTRKDPPTEQAKAVLSRLMPGVSETLKECDA